MEFMSFRFGIRPISPAYMRALCWYITSQILMFASLCPLTHLIYRIASKFFLVKCYYVKFWWFISNLTKVYTTGSFLSFLYTCIHIAIQRLFKPFVCLISLSSQILKDTRCYAVRVLPKLTGYFIIILFTEKKSSWKL